MRVSTNSMYQKNLNSILNTNNKWQKSGLHLATGKKILSPSDDPMGAAQSLILKQAQSRNGQFQAARESADKSLSRQDTILKEVNTVIQNIQEMLVYAGNETLNDENRRDLANKLQGLKDQLVALANSKDTNGNYLFAGNKNDTPPFVVDESGQVNYVGGTTTINVFIDDSREVSLSFTGVEAFMSGSTVKLPDGSPAESNIFASIDYAIEALTLELGDNNEDTIKQFREGLSKASCGVDNSFDNISTLRAKGGSVLEEVDRLTTLGKTLDIEFETQISQIEDVDWYEAISDYVMLQANLQAAQYTFMTMQNMSLFQMK
ncbi:flagellar hook-associated protein 3 [Gilliamella sp. Choc4-2]|jgi:flagellar hook-associated protein 3 FlgL|uniref:flagellar hook-associated protein FlgL n=1 Tax=unclassified Gilliamella TaxID=2685620 RepID=UPI0004DD62D5|nr:flagellar hook-associated protein FlgL [Gilliamella apicola]KFA58344.1 Flagellar hook-associated protein FlgL [Gilliamella apicola]OCG31043.1 flagellar hook-associated protein 3 [Gilliamella apicola]OCG46611.1 flagellar hook-associated protein 3 [Gilliamella apicola]OCG55894.1 flagellar hook-associated protein 3 [Gilliamella apicola]OCG64779.1 flagellar hook-associated protein 3 [Gilliamella apicola]